MLRLFYRDPGLNLYRCFSTRSPYKVLGLHDSAGKPEIKAAYIRLSKIYHPDKNTDDSTLQYQEIREAFDELMSLPETEGLPRTAPKTTSTRSSSTSTSQDYWSHKQGSYDSDPGFSHQANNRRSPGRFDYHYIKKQAKTRSVDDWVKSIERNARIRSRMAKGGRSKEGYFYTEEINENYKVFEKRFIHHIDKRLEFLKAKSRLTTERVFKNRVFTITSLFYLFLVKILITRGGKLVLLVAFILFVMDANNDDQDQVNRTK